MQTETRDADTAMRRFKKKLVPTHVKPAAVLPSGTYGTQGITLKPVPKHQPNLKVVARNN